MNAEGHTSCRIELLGGLRVRRGDHMVTQFETRKTAALLAYLAYFPGRGHLREALAEVVWPEEDPDATRARLRQSLGTLRRILGSAASASGSGTGAPGPSIVIADRVEVRLDSRALTTDVGEFERSLGLARQSADAAERARRLAHA